MIRLAIETATDFCSVGLEVDGATRVREALAPRRHAELLLPWIGELLAEAGLGYGDLDALAVSGGPGGFTSLRIGLSAAQGIALARDLPVHPVPTLAALAQAADPAGRRAWVLAVLDARMKEVYAAGFRRRAGVLESVAEPVVVAPARLQPPRGGPWLVAGSGLASYGEALEQSLAGAIAERHPDAWPDARSVLALAERFEAVEPWRLQPLYVRDNVAN
jgi:tRNA threonylcarbamoyladenosine biosynthesis protein TsaB